MSETTDTSTDVSLSDIFWRLWDGRGIIVFAPLLAAAVATLFVALSALQQSQHATYMVALRNIENQHYPSGAKFSPQDLLIPEVMSELRQRFNLPATVNLRSAISVSYDSPIADGIVRRYRDRLSARNLSSAEITAINDNYMLELGDAMQSSVRISVDYTALGVSADVGLAIARALPELWSTIYATRFRIFSDRRIANFAISRSAENLSTATSVMVADTRVNSMRLGIESFVEDNRLSLLQTEDGVSAVDLLIDLRQFETVWFNPIKASLLRGNDPVSQSYIHELRVTIADLSRQVDSFEKTLAELRDYMNPSPTTATDSAPTQSESGPAVQIGDSAVNTILHLAGRTNFSEFVKEILVERHEKQGELSRLTRQLELVQSENEVLRTSGEFRAQAEALLQDITTRYSQLVAAADNQLRTDGGMLYEPLLGPMVSGALLTTRNILIVAVAALAAGLLAIVGVLLWSSIRPKRVSAS